MCGRYALSADKDALALEFEVDATTEVQLPPRWNIAPTSDIYIVRERQEGMERVRELVVARWGLIPAWAKEESIGARMANARAETVAEKPAFRSAFAKRRCLVLCDGWYEWLPAQPAATGARQPKQPYLMTVAGRPHAAFAGLYEWWRAPGTDPDAPALLTANLLTTDAVGVAAKVHDRMPVVLDQHAWAAWLNPEGGSGAPTVLARAIADLPAQPVTIRPVTTDVNSVRNDGAYLWGEFSPPTPGERQDSDSGSGSGHARHEPQEHTLF